MGNLKKQPAVKVRMALAVGALLSSLLAFHLLGPVILFVPGLLYLAQKSLPFRYRVLLCASYGTAFAGIFYGWALHYGWLPWLGLVMVRGLPWALFGLPSNVLEARSRNPRAGMHALSCGLGYALVSFLLLAGPTGADWETPAAALTSWPWAISLLPWIWLYGVAFLLGFCSCLLFSGRAVATAGGAGLLAAWMATGWLVFQNRSANELSLSVGLIQTGWEQSLKWDEENVERVRRRLFELTEKAAEGGAELVVWPETAWPIRGMRRRPSDTRAIGRLARRLEVEILASSIEEVEDGWYNSVSQVLPTGRFEAEYRKIRLAPFAEHIPLPRHHNDRLRQMQPFSRISPYLPGEERVFFQSHGREYGVLVCYESMICGPAAEVNLSADFIVVVTNDAPFRWESPREAHFRSAILRAIQYRIPVFQAANTGVTGFVDARGVVRARTEPGFSGPVVLVVEG